MKGGHEGDIEQGVKFAPQCKKLFAGVEQVLAGNFPHGTDNLWLEQFNFPFKKGKTRLDFLF